jgi:hypothetical protein
MVISMSVILALIVVELRESTEDLDGSRITNEAPKNGNTKDLTKTSQKFISCALMSSS